MKTELAQKSIPLKVENSSLLSADQNQTGAGRKSELLLQITNFQSRFFLGFGNFLFGFVFGFEGFWWGFLPLFL